MSRGARCRVVALVLVVGLGATTVTAHGARGSESDAPSSASSMVENAPGPFSEILPPPEVAADSPAAKQYLGFERDLTDRVEARSLLADQIKARGLDVGWSGTIVNPETNALTVYWKGKVPAELRRSLASDPYGISVELRENAPYSRLEQREAIERVINDERATRDWDVVGGAARPDGSGIDVYVAAKAASRSSVQGPITETAQVAADDIRFEFGAAKLQDLSRNNSNPPWRGGIRTIASLACSTGFTALKGSAGRLLSASHCHSSGATKNHTTSIAPDANHYHRASIDALGIDPTASPATSPKIYVGDWDSTQIRGVRNWSSNNVGDDVCSSGATLGTKCGRVTHDDFAVTGLEGSWYIRVRNGGLGVGAQGDSGGPVYTTYANGEKQARGLVIKGDNGDRWYCQHGNPDVVPGAWCYGTMIYVPISVVLNKFGYSLEID